MHTHTHTHTHTYTHTHHTHMYVSYMATTHNAALHMASANGHLEIAKRLLSAGAVSASFNSKDDTLLCVFVLLSS